MRLYDLTSCSTRTRPTTATGRSSATSNSAIEGKGKLVGQHDWGMRRMAFEIDHRPDAAYHLFQFEGENDLLEQLDNTLKITDGVLRHRIIKVKPGTPPPPDAAARGAARRPRARGRAGRRRRPPARPPTPLAGARRSRGARRGARAGLTRALPRSLGRFQGARILHPVRFYL